jgi:hypothetical protein
MVRDALLLGSLCTLLGGCATMIHGRYQEVHLESVPPGATVVVSPLQSERGPAYLDTKKQTVTTPATVRLRRDNTYRVELQKPGYKLATNQVQSSYDWLWAPVTCGPCEAIGQLPTYDMKEHALPVRFLEAAFYEYPKGLFRAFGYGLRLFSPEALMGTSYKLKPAGAGFFDEWHGLGEPTVSTTLEPTG